jgi:hypothetical protein
MNSEAMTIRITKSGIEYILVGRYTRLPKGWRRYGVQRPKNSFGVHPQSRYFAAKCLMDAQKVFREISQNKRGASLILPVDH